MLELPLALRVESLLLAYAPKSPAGRKPPTRLAVLALLASGPFDRRSRFFAQLRRRKGMGYNFGFNDCQRSRR